MSSILMKIQDTVVKYADIVSKISQVDVEVVDERLFRVAGTGMFSGKVNEDMSAEGYVYHQVLKTGRRQVIYEPGREPICQSCPHCNACREEIEISMSIRLGSKIIGIIGLVGSTREQKDRIMQDEQLYMDFLEQIAEFISAKAGEYVEMENKDALLGTLNCTISHIEQGIMIRGSDGSITAANDAAKRQLEISMLEGNVARIVPTGDRMNDLTEYKLRIRDREFSVMGCMHELPKVTNRFSDVVVFDNIKDMQKKYYGTSTTMHPVDFCNIIGDSPQMKRLKAKIGKIARSSSTVLITGESGTGKEMVASTIWNASGRKDGRFVAINCAAIPEALLESELFGYVKGAFTGADPNGRIGKFELADKGMIFLDEIGDMPLYLQAKLLRVLQERKIIRIGSNQMIPIDVRIVAATNKDLKQMIREKKFREDLYYRLNVIPLEIPPLRERKEDIEMLAVFFAKRYARLLKKDFWKIPETVMDRLKAHPWEGNVRELENVMEFMVNMVGSDGILDEQTLPNDFRKQESRQTYRKEPESREDEVLLSLKELECREIRRALEKFGNTTQGKKEAARVLGISLATLYRKMEEIS